MRDQGGDLWKTRMLMRRALLLFTLCAFGSPALADDAVAPKLPTFALEQPPAAAASPSPWSGFHIGSEVFAFSGRHVKGGVGGAVVAGYDHEFANNFVIGIDAKTGYAPFPFRHGPFKGFDYAATDVKLGYDMGRLMPFVTAGFVVARPQTGARGGYVGATESVNDLFDGSSRLQGAATVGAGFDYAVTDRLHIGAAVTVGAGRGGLIAP
jgi:opacity protein-like surface antigen